MIRTDMPREAAEFLALHNQHAEHPEATQALVYLNHEGRITGALAYHHANALSCMCDIALESTFPRTLLHAGLWYPFTQLGLRRLTFFIAADNLRSIALVEKLGAFREATLQDGCSTGEAYIYCLRPEKCPLWSKFNGKRRLGPTGS